MTHQVVPRINQIDEAVAEVFDQMLGRSCVPTSTESELEPIACESSRGLTASVLFSGSLNGTCTVHLDLSTAGELTALLTGETYDPDGPSHLSADMVGELCNMIAGSWKSRLPSEQARCGLSSPVITSEQSQLQTTELAGNFKHSLVRVYRIHDQCLILQLRFD